MEQNTKPGSHRVAATLFVSVALVVGALVLWLGSAAAGTGGSNQPSNQPPAGPAANAAPVPEADPTPDPKPAEPAPQPAEVPTGTVQDNGLAFKLPFDRGEGSLVFARQGNDLRVDALVRYPYYAGDGSRDRGSVFALTLSVSGNAGRQLLLYPSPIWQGGPPPLFRVEGRYSKDDGITQLQEEPSFSGSCDVKSWDSWRATLLVDLRMVLVPGNSPAQMADNWMAGIVAGNEVARMIFPKGMDEKNPARTPASMLKFKFSELPELKGAEADARDKAIAVEQEQQEATRKLAALFAQRNYAAFQQETGKAVAKFPGQLWPKYLAYAIALVGFRNELEGVNKDYLAPLKEYIAACPGQSHVHLEYVNALLGTGRYDEAVKHMEEVFKSPLVTGSETAGINISLRYAAQLGTQGYLDEASKIVAKWEGSAAIANDKTLAGLFESVKAPLSAAQAQWEAELKAREEDAKKKNPTLTVESTQGKFVIELFEDDAPNTVASMVSLAQKGFYNGLTFHRFVENFVIQGGCPKGTGEGGPGYRLKSEVSKRNHFRGMVGMACTRPKANTEGSQFYVCLTNFQSVKGLSGSYVIVGRVIEGMDVVDKLRVGDKMTTVTAGNLRDHKYEPETIKE